MITEQDLQAAIAECQGKRNPDASTCIKLAAFYTIKKELFPSSDQQQRYPEPSYSFAPAPDKTDDTYVVIDSDTEFAQTVDGKRQEEVWPVIDELMTIIKTLHPRLYAAVLSKF